MDKLMVSKDEKSKQMRELVQKIKQKFRTQMQSRQSPISRYRKAANTFEKFKNRNEANTSIIS